MTHILKSRVALAVALAFLAQAGIATAAEPIVKVTGGQVEGAVTGDLTIYKAVPFAAPPVGDLRWRAPQPVKPWTGVRPAKAFAGPCMQPMSPLVPAGPPPSEDCLYLNVWAPTAKAAKPRPVIVWIHGGAFTMGGATASLFDGSKFAQRGVVLVTVPYRLGAIGFLAHPELTRESGRGSGNYGIQDQVAALRWVRDNIAVFGGDPGNVTIMGQSAGAGSVSILTASPLTMGLFHRAIAESGASFAPPPRVEGAMSMVGEKTAAEKQGEQALAALGAASIADGRKLPAEALFKARGPFPPNQDGYVVAKDHYGLYAAGRQHDTPVLVGFNSADGAGRPVAASDFEAQMRATYGSHADAILAAYPHATPEQAKAAATGAARDSIFGWNTWTWARLQSRTGKGKAYTYYFDKQAPRNSMFYSPDGASHTGEVPYVFGTLDASIAYTDEDRALSELMMSYWVNFARTGDPNDAGLPRWPAFTEAAPTTQYFTAKPHTGPMPDLPQIAAFDAYYQAQRPAAK